MAHGEKGVGRMKFRCSAGHTGDLMDRRKDQCPVCALPIIYLSRTEIELKIDARELDKFLSLPRKCPEDHALANDANREMGLPDDEDWGDK